MPGYTDWKGIFREELFQMGEEGYDLADAPKLTADRESLEGVPSDDAHWEAAYKRLRELAKRPLRADYPYEEPDDLEEIFKAAAPVPALVPLTDEQYRERIAGAFTGRVAGVVLGKPIEMGVTAEWVRNYLEGADAWPLNDYIPLTSSKTGITARMDCKDCTLDNIHYASCDDDIQYTLLAINLAKNKGFDFTHADIGRNWLDNVPYHWFWCASRQAYYHLVREDPIEEIPTSINPWRECIDGQIRTDAWGYLSPGDPRRAAAHAHKECSFSLVKNGVYGGMFVTGCIAAALSQNPTVDTILDGGLSVIPKKSRLAESVGLVRKWYAETGSYDDTCKKIYEKYAYLPMTATVNNLAVVTLALLEGKMDYTKTICAAVCGGLDTDCNGGTAGSIIGAAVGIKGIEPRWYECLEDCIHTNVAAYGQTKISTAIAELIELHEKLG